MDFKDTIEATGNSEKIQALLRVLEPYGIKELVQSGLVAMERGLKPGISHQPDHD